jgi:threonine/homoserine/homoserine lactone efflux protein
MALQLALTVTGMSAILAASASWFSWLRWAGAVYLVYLGVRAWRAAPLKGTQSAPAPPSVTVFTRGVLISLTNPKTLLFFGAFCRNSSAPNGRR